MRQARPRLAASLAVAACLASPAAPAFATIDLIPKEIEVRDGAAVASVVNNGDRPEYVSVSLSRITNPGVALSREVLEPVGDAAEPALYAFPFRVTLAPGQTKTLVLKPLRPAESELDYRLDVRPTMAARVTADASVTGAITTNLAFSGLVRQLPATQRASIAVTCTPSGATVVNTGNVRYAVEGARVDGVPSAAFNVYPGVPLTLPGRTVEIPDQPRCDTVEPAKR